MPTFFLNSLRFSIHNMYKAMDGNQENKRKWLALGINLFNWTGFLSCLLLFARPVKDYAVGQDFVDPLPHHTEQ
jgi:hypothetical protein